MTRQIPWFRILVEGVVIVGSILLAFGIDAWWDGRRERQEEREALEGLERDFSVNLRAARTSIMSLRADNRALAALEDILDAQLASVSSDSALLFARAMNGYRTFDPQDGTLDALLASGRLGVLRDGELRGLLVEWKTAVDDVNEEASLVVAARTRLYERASQLGGPWRYVDDADQRQFPPIDLTVAAGDPELMAWFRLKSLVSVGYIYELEPLAEQARRILAVITAQRRSNTKVVSISVSSPVDSVAVHDWGYFAAEVSLSDGSMSDVSASATWTSSDSSVISVLESGLGTAVGVGSSDVCAAYEGQRACVVLNVTR